MTSPPITADKGERLDSVLKRMAKHGITKMPVVDQGKLVGILTDGLVADKLGASRARGLVPGHLHAAKVMSRDVEPVSMDTPLDALLPKVGLPGLTMLPVIERGELVGVHTKSDLLPFVTSAARVDALMKRNVQTVGPDERLIHARHLLLEHDVQRLPVLERGALVGLIAEWEIADAFARFLSSTPPERQKHGVRELRVRDFMRGDVVTVAPEAAVRDAAGLMLENDVGGLPVLREDGKLVGIVTRTDLIRTLPGASADGAATAAPRGPARNPILKKLSERRSKGTVTRNPR